MINERDITLFFHSRYAVVMLVVAVCLVTIAKFPDVLAFPALADKGIALPTADTWLSHGDGSLYANLVLNIAIVGMMVYINRRFNVLRSITMIYAWLFVVLQFAIPEIMSQFYSGTVLCLVVMVCTIILFSSYNDRSSPQRVMLVFALLSLGALTQYAFIPYMLVFFAGCGQMRIMNMKSLLAAVIGIITPVWIVCGLGIISWGDFKMPDFSNTLAAMEPDELFQLLLSFGITAFICIVSLFFNIMRILGYNAHTRAFNGFLFLLSLATLLMALIDYTNLVTYIPLFNCCTAFQLGHIFVLGSEARRGYIGPLLVIIAYTGLYLMDVWL